MPMVALASLCATTRSMTVLSQSTEQKAPAEFAVPERLKSITILTPGRIRITLSEDFDREHSFSMITVSAVTGTILYSLLLIIGAFSRSVRGAALTEQTDGT